MYEVCLLAFKGPFGASERLSSTAAERHAKQFADDLKCKVKSQPEIGEKLSRCITKIQKE